MIPIEFRKGSLEDRSLILVDIETIKPTHVFNVDDFTSAFNLKWFEANKTESIGVDVVGVLTLANACKDHSLPM